MPSQRYVGQLLYPPPPRNTAVRGTVGGAESLGLIEDKPQDGDDQLDPAVEVSVNPRFGLVAVGTKRSVLPCAILGYILINVSAASCSSFLYHPILAVLDTLTRST